MKRLPLCLAVASIVAAAQPVLAQDFTSQQFVAPSEQWLTLDLGGIVNTFDTSIRVDGQTTTGTPIGVENNGADDKVSSFEAGLVWRMAPNHRLALSYFGATREGTRNYTSEIVIGDNVYPLGATVSMDVKDRFLIADYMWSFVRQPEFEASLILGIYGGKFEANIDAVGNAGSVTSDYHKNESTALPLPLIGISAEWSPDKRWKFTGQAKGFKANIGDVDGSIYMLEGRAEWMLMRGFGLGVRYRYVDVQVDVDKSSFKGNLDWKTNSVSLYGKFVF
jgi:hypothetical protein